MNDKDKEAFTKWFCLTWELYTFNFGNLLEGGTKLNSEYSFKLDLQNKAWQAACEYKQKEIDEYKEAASSEAFLVNELQVENAKLRNDIKEILTLSFYDLQGDDLEVLNGFKSEYLKELGDK